MFLRKWDNLPKDPIFPDTLKELGYFINKDDEVRSIENEDYYFKYFINTNERICDRQRYSFDHAIQAEVHERLVNLGLKKYNLPLGTSDLSQPHVPVLASADIAKKSRVVMIFGEVNQKLGILAYRVACGRGGINKGSMVSIVEALLKQQTSSVDSSPPGIVLANMGELLWNPDSKRALTTQAFRAMPMRSGAHKILINDNLHRIPGQENSIAHVKYMFEEFVPEVLDDDAQIDIIALGDGSDKLISYLDNHQAWDMVGHRLHAFASVGGRFSEEDFQVDGFRQFMRERGHVYVMCSEPLGTVLSNADGNPKTELFTGYGCPAISAGSHKFIETLFIGSHPTVLSWIQKVALAGPEGYKNPEYDVEFADPEKESDTWDDVEREGGLEEATKAMEEATMEWKSDDEGEEC